MENKEGTLTQNNTIKKQLSQVRSLFEFNKRVLAQGYVHPGCSIKPQEYSYALMEKKLFFNQVFISNMDEMFEKYDCSSIIEEYHDSIMDYRCNIDMLCTWLHAMHMYTIKTNCDDIDQLVESYKSLDGLISSGYLLKDMLTTKNIMNRSGSIIYIGLSEEDLESDNPRYQYVYVDMANQVYSNTHITSRRMSDFEIRYNCPTLEPLYNCWKTEEVIKSYMKYMMNIPISIAVKITSRGKHQKVTKVEIGAPLYWDRTMVEYPNKKRALHLANDLAKYIRSILPGVTIVNNPYLITQDIAHVLDRATNNHKHPTPTEKKIRLDDIFRRDYLLEYPSDSFKSYLDILSEAAHSEHVSEIYITLYRIGKDTRLFKILCDAISNDIDVYVNLELYASGESINRIYFNKLKEIGAHVTNFGDGTCKVHCKLTLIQYYDGRRIAQVGTGNFNPTTTVQYTDLSLLTSDNSICSNVENVFREIGLGHGFIGPFGKAFYTPDLLVTPEHNARDILNKLIKRETALGKDGFICFKCNSLDDDGIIYHLHRAAQAGCQIKLIIRGICTWNGDDIDLPNVSVKSIVWDKLEHSRVYCFGNNEPTIYIGSLDLVTRKIIGRVETLVQIKDPDIIKHLSNYLNDYITNRNHTWTMNRLGTYDYEN